MRALLGSARRLVGIGECRRENPDDAAARAFRIFVRNGNRQTYASAIWPDHLFKPILGVLNEAAKSCGNIGASGISAAKPASRAFVTNAIDNVGDGVVPLHRFAAEKFRRAEPFEGRSLQLGKMELCIV